MPDLNFSQLPILEDFEIFLTFLKRNEPIMLTNEKAQLKKDDLFRLNEEMHFKTEWVTEKSVQYAYPLLDFFYQVVVKSKIARIYHTDKAKILKPDFEKLTLYDAMSAAGQYFFMLETLWRFINWAKIMEMRGNYFLSFITPGLELISLMDENQEYEIVDRSLKGLSRKDNIDFVLGRKLYEIFWFLGFYELKPRTKLLKKPDKYTFPYASLKANVLGTTLIPVLLEQRPLETWNLPLRREVELDEADFFFDLKEALDSGDDIAEPKTEVPVPTEQAILPAETDNADFLVPFLSIAGLQDIEESFYTNASVFKAGCYILKIALDTKLYRTVVLGANHTLFNLHEIIQEAFKFENDHLYAFFMDNELWSSEAYYDPEAERGYPADLVKLGDLDLAAGQRFLYVFDFGAQWIFDITVLEIQENKPEPEISKIIEKVGRAPKQYGNW